MHHSPIRFNFTAAIRLGWTGKISGSFVASAAGAVRNVAADVGLTSSEVLAVGILFIGSRFLWTPAAACMAQVWRLISLVGPAAAMPVGISQRNSVGRTNIGC